MNILISILEGAALLVFLLFICALITIARTTFCKGCPYSKECDINKDNNNFVPQCHKKQLVFPQNSTDRII